MLTDVNIVSIDAKLELLGLAPLQPNEVSYINYINFTITTICDEWAVIQRVIKVRLNNGSCSNPSIQDAVKELMDVDGCIYETPVSDNDSSFLIGFDFKINNRC